MKLCKQQNRRMPLLGWQPGENTMQGRIKAPFGISGVWCWLTKVNPGYAGEKIASSEEESRQEKTPYFPIMVEVVCRPHNYSNEEVSLEGDRRVYRGLSLQRTVYGHADYGITDSLRSFDHSEGCFSWRGAWKSLPAANKQQVMIKNRNNYRICQKIYCNGDKEVIWL